MNVYKTKVEHSLKAPKVIFREYFKANLVFKDDVRLAIQMVNYRNLTTHEYAAEEQMTLGRCLTTLSLGFIHFKVLDRVDISYLKIALDTLIQI